ncbi:MAG: AlwI family type II restriction endonuclease, partial [Clostridiales bacterium]|nr:AlwI family type II restriction endonuclease [Clostridiales bacterium]
NYSEYKKYATEEEYFEYMATIDKNLISEVAKPASVIERDKFLAKWVDVYSWEQIKEELMILAKKKLTKDDILKYLSNPIRLEFLIALAIKSKFPNVKVIPNYPYNDEGLPTSTAAGNGDKGDIECFEDVKGILVEVSMSEGRIQTVMEIWPIARHLEEFKKNTPDSMCYFVAPSIFKDSVMQINYVKEKEKLSILPKTIEEFLAHIETSAVLYSNI